MSMKVSSADGVMVRKRNQMPCVDVDARSSFSTASSPSHLKMSPPSFLFVLIPNQVYNVSSGKNTPQWLSESKKRALRKDEEYR